MTITLSPTQDQIQTALVGFLTTVLPSGVVVIAGQSQANRTAEPVGSDFVVFWPLMRNRLETNTDTFVDAVFTGSIAGTVLTIATVVEGSVFPGSTLFGVGLATNTVSGTQISGTPGESGTYNVTPSQTVAGPITLSAGTNSVLQPVDVVMQIDVHGPNSSDNAQIISTLFRDSFATTFFDTALPSAGVEPLYADDPRQVPFINAEQQYETRYVVDVHIQADQTVSGLPQDAASVVNIEAESVDATFPP